MLRRAFSQASSSNRGREAEEVACNFLLKRGAHLLERNYRCRSGEIDLIMRDAGTLLFIEVRYRRDARFGSGAESVDRRKQNRLITAAQHYLQVHPEAARYPARFDVISIGTAEMETDVEWIRDAFQVPG